MALLPFDAGQPLDLKISLTMGQAFRWKADGNGWFSGVVQGQHIKVRQPSPGVLEFRGQPGPDAEIERILKTYLRLDEGNKIAAIYADLSNRDGKIAELIAKYPGLRILRQEPWECLVSYICSANNKVEQIGKLVERISKRFGDPILLDGETRRSFPNPERLKQAGASELEALNLGLQRHIKIHRAAMEVVDGSLNLKDLQQMPYAQARKRLKQCYGVGDKIADCVSLFSLDKPDAFPIDRHIRNALAGYFPGVKMPSDGRLRDWAQGYFVPNAGYAGQFLFYAQRRKQAKSR